MFSSPDSRIRQRRDYKRCYERGRRRHGTFTTLHVVDGRGDRVRVGITVTRRVGGAVVRNRIKRRLREICRLWRKWSELPPLDIVIHVKPSAAEASFWELRAEIEKALDGLLGRRSAS